MAGFNRIRRIRDRVDRQSPAEAYDTPATYQTDVEHGALRSVLLCFTMPLPEWWDWELELTAHSKARLEERGLTEIDLRTMLDKQPNSIAPDPEPGRHRVCTSHRRKSWIVVVEPDPVFEVLVIISVFRAEP